MGPSIALRAITHRLTTTPTQELPHVVSYLAVSIGNCSDVIASAQTKKAANVDESDSLQVNKLKTRLTSLLQDRSFEGRWAGVVLVKATIEAGQWEILHDCGPWVRGLLSILSKPDPVSTKRLSIITLTRIFHLTYRYPTLVREITTPSLPPFITALLNLIIGKQSTNIPTQLKEPRLLETVLSALIDLIGRHPTIFRPFLNQLQSLLLPIVGSSTLSSSLSSEAVHVAQNLFISLHHCASKNTSNEKWANDCKHTIASIHQTADHIFRSVIEQWESSDPNFKPSQSSKIQSSTPVDDAPNALGLPPWQGLHAGVNRIVTLLGLLSNFMSARTPSAVNVPIGAILDLTSRLTSVTFPRDGDETSQGNREFSRDERVALWSELPRIHGACIDLFCAIIRSFSTSLTSVIQPILEQSIWTFEADLFDSDLRRSSYSLMTEILPLVGRSMSKANVFTLATLIRQCCRDLILPENDQTTKSQQSDSKTKSKGTQSLNVDAFLLPSQGANPSKDLSSRNTYSAALRLLPIIYNFLPVEYIPLPVRAEMDRTAVLTGNREAMSAGVMNPMPSIKGRRPIPSILPFLTRRHSKELEVECLLRPRMPVILGGANVTFEADDYEEEQYVPSAIVSGIDVQDVPPAASNEDLAQSHNVLQPLLLQSKRNFSDHLEPSSTRPSQDTPEQRGFQVKKPRLEDESNVLTAQPTPVTLSETALSPAVVPSASVPSFPTAHNTDDSVLGSVATRVQSSGPREVLGNARPDNPSGDSDDDMPTLNIEPDTDEDEDD
ncbi:rRNA processing/ribosome biogenesis-domain-containing protein [Talaromyces proteolyticus]|uniref:Pre-rRNA-processing protein RIX1 n=1 Tax=Talaromyces proteolyticus TaxID=1131652 RepID=A0AAD4Q4A7_9EURO|nr:rRNA processing/ribosome biogenesis-domain-containing protein [Talaromyces proteolyticus]KAH8702531.1 rRNA processing/ribosome biogenesis-domain-containing protein [Talaromyces proteolyticus]